MSNTYTHLTLEERAWIQVGLEQNLSLRAIARKLKRAPSTITREFARNADRLAPTNSPEATGPPLAAAYLFANAHQRAQHLAQNPHPTQDGQWKPLVVPCT